ncbi:MAG: L-2-hydroxyglutarate oxidase [Dehalococcoidia bacterium]|nr:L-2-hydroxyglutarate oxidase [Dehalococcoidia bacterium]
MNTSNYDICIIGGGIIGLSTAFQLLQRFPRLRVAVVEKEDRLAVHQTGHNSGVIHSGIYYRPGSQKAQFCAGGVDSLVRFCDENEIPYERCGKVIVATDESELGRLDTLYERGTANGVPGLRMIGPEELAEVEPYARGIRALHSPATGIVDYTRVAYAYASRFDESGGVIYLDSRVLNITSRGDATILSTSSGDVSCRNVVNCAGLYSDRVAQMMGAPSPVQIVPFRGEYYTLKDESRDLVRTLIYPVPNPRFPFLGVHFTRNIHGHVEAGPNAVLAYAREGYRKSRINPGELASTLTFRGFWSMSRRNWKIGLGEMHRSLSRRIFLKDLQRLVPAVQNKDLAPGGAGVRAQAVDRNGALLDDFNIWQTAGAIHVLNAPSPGATSSISIGQHIVGLAAENFGLDG